MVATKAKRGKKVGSRSNKKCPRESAAKDYYRNKIEKIDFVQGKKLQ